MCEYSTKLIAWLDRELEPEEMDAVQQHLPNCAECNARLAKCERISRALDEYCDVVMTTSQCKRTGRRWVPVLSAAAAILVIAATAAVFWHARVQPRKTAPALLVRSVTAIHAAPSEASQLRRPAAATKKSTRAHRTNSPAAPRPVNWVPSPPALQVAIPADLIFPPGAVPEGISFIADVNFAPDGSARQIRLRPRLTATERSASQP
jgi:Putative zinc-finger